MRLNVTQATENSRWYANRYASMSTSIVREERVNAEACRIGSRAWQEILVLLKDRSDPPLDFEAEMQRIVDAIDEEWGAYCKTGIPREEFNPKPEAMHYNVQKFQNEQKARDLKAVAEAALRQKNKNKGESDPAPPTVEPTPVAPKIDNEVVGFIDPVAIYEVINGIMYSWKEITDYCETTSLSNLYAGA